MKSVKRTCIAAIAFVAARAIPALPEIVHAPVNVMIDKNGHYHIDRLWK